MDEPEWTINAPRLVDQARDVIRVLHYSCRTKHAYVAWIRRFILCHQKRHPRSMGATEIRAFLTHLAVQRNIASSTQNQALSACAAFISTICLMASARLNYLPHCRANTPMRPVNGHGSRYSRLIAARSVHEPGESAAIMSMNQPCKELLSRQVTLHSLESLASAGAALKGPGRN